MAGQTRVTAGGTVTGVLRGAPGETARRLGVRLDGRYCGTVVATLAGAGILYFAWELPAHLLAERFALLDGDEELPESRVDLRDYFDLRAGPFSDVGGAIQGSFVCCPAVADEIEVVFRDGPAVFARTLARRGADGRHHLCALPDRLMPLGTIARLTPCIGGLDLSGPELLVTPAQLGMVGGVGEVTASHVNGWIASAGPPPEVCLVQDGLVLDTVRPRLNAADPSDRRAIFALRRPVDATGPAEVVIAGRVTRIDVAVDLAPAWQGRLERVSRSSAHGWVRDPGRPGHRLLLEAVVDGEVLARAEADIFRGDVADAGLGDGYCGFRLDLSAHALKLGGRVLVVRVAGSARTLDGSPRVLDGNPALDRFLRRADGVAPALRMRLGRMMDYLAGSGGVSVVLAPGQATASVLDGLRGQYCGRWEALCVGGTPGDPDPRIRAVPAPRRGGLAAAMNAGVLAAGYEHVVFLTVPARLEPDAVHHLLQAGTRFALLFWDEAVVHTDRGGVADAVCRGAFSPDLFASRPDLGTGFCLPAGVARAVRWQAGPTPMVDFLNRMLAQVPLVGHIPRILAVSPGDARTVLPAAAAPALVADDGEVLIVIPTHNAVDVLRRCLDSIRATAGDVPYRIVVIDHRSGDPATRRYLGRLGRRATVMRYEGEFNYAAMNNLAVANHGGAARFVLFLNNDTEALHPGWLDRMRRIAARPEIGAVGTLLLYPDLRVQHAGVVLGVGGVAGHALALDAAYRDGKRLPGPQGLLTALRDVSAVTAACMMMRRAAFDAVGGFDARFAVGFNDTDLCLRLRRHGLRVLYDGQTVLLHHESRTRRQTGQLLHHADTRRFKRRWARLLQAGDPYYHPQLSLIAADWELREECAPPAPPRFVRPDGRPTGG